MRKRGAQPHKLYKDFLDTLGTRVTDLPRAATHRDKKKYTRKGNKKELRDAYQ